MDEAAGRHQGATPDRRGERDAVEHHEAVVVSEAALRVLALIEGSALGCDPPACPGCGADVHHRWGSLPESGTRRWRCRACARTFTAKTGTLLAGLHSPEKLRDVVVDMFAAEPRSCRKLGAALELDKTTIWTWRCKINALLLGQAHGSSLKETPDAVEVVRESRKASREWVNHRRDPDSFPEPDRLRWLDYAQHQLPLPDPMTPHLIAVLLGTCILSALPAAAAAVDDASADGEDQPRSTTTANHPAVDHGARGRLTKPVSFCRSAELQSLPDRQTAVGRAIVAFRQFIGAFRGPSTRHLNGYVAWFEARCLAPIS